MTPIEILEGDLLSTIDEAQAAGRFVARGYADEMRKLGMFLAPTGTGHDELMPAKTESEKADDAKVEEEEEGEAELAGSIKGPEGDNLLKVLIHRLGGQ